MPGFSVRVSIHRKAKALGNLVLYLGAMAWMELLIYSLRNYGAAGIPQFKMKESADRAIKNEANT